MPSLHIMVYIAAIMHTLPACIVLAPYQPYQILGKQGHSFRINHLTFFPTSTSLTPNPQRNMILVKAPAYTNPILPISIALHAPTSQYCSLPNLQPAAKCPKSAINIANTNALQTGKWFPAARSTKASVRAK